MLFLLFQLILAQVALEKSHIPLYYYHTRFICGKYQEYKSNYGERMINSTKLYDFAVTIQDKRFYSKDTESLQLRGVYAVPSTPWLTYSLIVFSKSDRWRRELFNPNMEGFYQRITDRIQYRNEYYGYDVYYGYAVLNCSISVEQDAFLFRIQ
jgi:hypothetical protein